MSLKNWELFGILIIILLGTFLHFAYDLSGENPFVALVAPVNESVWEHLKLAFYGMMFYAAIEYLFIGYDYRNFLFAKIFSAIIASLLIIVFYYGYTTFIEGNLFMDISIYILAIIIGQVFSYGIIQSNFYFQGLDYLSIITGFLVILIFASYTYEPPQTDLFLDHPTKTYGKP